MILKKIVYFMWFKYYEPKDLEIYLEEQGKKGWHPEKINFGSIIKTKFLKGQSVNYRYVVDCQYKPGKNYISTNSSHGWTLVGKFSDIYIWRLEAEAYKAEPFSHFENLKERNKRLSYMYIMFEAICILYAVISALMYIRNFTSLTVCKQIYLIIAFAITAFLILLLGKRIYRLKLKTE